MKYKPKQPLRRMIISDSQNEDPRIASMIAWYANPFTIAWLEKMDHKKKQEDREYERRTGRKPPQHHIGPAL